MGPGICQAYQPRDCILGSMILAIVITIYVVLGGLTAGYLTRVGRRPWTWQQPLRVPKVVETPIPEYYDGSVGLV